MANQFIARKGLISLSDAQITGSLQTTGTLTVAGATTLSSTLAVTGLSTFGGNIEVAKATAKIIIDSSSSATLDIDRSATTEGAKINFQTAGTETWSIGMQDSDDWGDGTPFYMGIGSSAASAKFVLNTSGVVTLGTVTPDVFFGATPKLQVESTDSASSISVFRNSNAAAGPYLFLGKSRGTAVNSDTIVQDDDPLGTIYFIAADGTDRASQTASIASYVDGTPGANDTPGRLVFATTTDGNQ